MVNNRPGNDAKILKRFKEPAWNYQVVRYLDANAKDLIPREDGVWTVSATAKRMAKVLKVAGRPVPAGLAGLR